jgi:Flp pilus assembly secretin CpaC
MLRKLVTIIGVAMLFALPASAANDDIEIAINKAHLIQLDADANIVLIANPEIADVAVESPRIIFLLGKSPGETSLFILDAEGNDLVRAEVIVSADIGDPTEPMADMITSVEPMPMMTSAPSAPKPKEHDVTIYRNISSATTVTCSPECGGSDGTQ